jgi:hypothetical protein
MPAKRIFTEDEKQLIIKLFTKDNKSLKEMSKIINVDSVVISKNLNSWGYVTSKVKKFTNEELAYMINEYCEKYTTLDVLASHFNVDPSVIKNRLTKNGVKVIGGSPYNYSYWVKRGMSDEEAKEHVKTLRPSNVKYWINKGFSEEEAKIKIEGQKLTSLRGCIDRYGEEEGTKIWNSREEKRTEWGKLGNTNLKYWINKGFTEEEAKIKLSERQSTFSKEKCIEKYGEEEGLKVWRERQINWQNSLYKNGKLKSGYSNISQELFDELLKNYNINDRSYVTYAIKGGEHVINKGDSFFRYDFVDLKNKKIIEYNGDQYHANPKQYLAEDYPHPFRKDITSKEIWDKDKLKKELAENEGFEILYVWDSEYRCGDKEKVIDKCLKFLNIK